VKSKNWPLLALLASRLAIAVVIVWALGHQSVARAETMTGPEQGLYVGVVDIVDLTLGLHNTLTLGLAEGFMPAQAQIGEPDPPKLLPVTQSTMQSLLRVKNKLREGPSLVSYDTSLGQFSTPLASAVLHEGQKALGLALQAIEMYGQSFDAPGNHRLRLEARALNCSFHQKLHQIIFVEPQSLADRRLLSAARFHAYQLKLRNSPFSQMLPDARRWVCLNLSDREVAMGGSDPATPGADAGTAPERGGIASGIRHAVIRYKPGQPIMVNVRINGNITAQLVLDTGADHTLINPRTLKAAGVALDRIVRRGQMAGVTGTDSVNYVVVESLEVGNARVTSLPVAAYEMPRANGDGLLGRDFLDRFKVNIDSRRGEVTISPR
jgi:predicted aspartyl protease